MLVDHTFKHSSGFVRYSIGRGTTVLAFLYKERSRSGLIPIQNRQIIVRHDLLQLSDTYCSKFMAGVDVDQWMWERVSSAGLARVSP